MVLKMWRYVSNTLPSWTKNKWSNRSAIFECHRYLANVWPIVCSIKKGLCNIMENDLLSRWSTTLRDGILTKYRQDREIQSNYRSNHCPIRMSSRWWESLAYLNTQKHKQSDEKKKDDTVPSIICSRLKLVLCSRWVQKRFIDWWCKKNFSLVMSFTAMFYELRVSYTCELEY